MTAPLTHLCLADRVRVGLLDLRFLLQPGSLAFFGNPFRGPAPSRPSLLVSLRPSFLAGGGNASFALHAPFPFQALLEFGSGPPLRFTARSLLTFEIVSFTFAVRLRAGIHLWTIRRRNSSSSAGGQVEPPQRQRCKKKQG